MYVIYVMLDVLSTHRLFVPLSPSASVSSPTNEVDHTLFSPFPTSHHWYPSVVLSRAPGMVPFYFSIFCVIPSNIFTSKGLESVTTGEKRTCSVCLSRSISATILNIIFSSFISLPQHFRLSFLLLLLFVLPFSRQCFSARQPWLFWNSLCWPSWPRFQRFTCLRLGAKVCTTTSRDSISLVCSYIVYMQHIFNYLFINWRTFILFSRYYY